MGMTKEGLVNLLREKHNLSKRVAEEIVAAIFDSILETLSRGEEVNIVGFGSFFTAARKSRPGVNPRTGEKITIPEMKVPRFRPGKKLKETIRR